MQKLSKLKEIKDLRAVWPHEAQDFTPWLAEEENLNLLADTVGLEISLDETESSVGDFNVDIYATETGTGKKIIIENQLEDTNHDHLGKLITYASGKSAEIIIWIVKRAREEHRAAIEWLNNHTDEKVSFFLLEIKLYQIGNSDIAVKFEVVEKPNDWVKENKSKVSSTPVLQARLDYWMAFNNYAFMRADFSKVFKKRKPSTEHWMSFGVGTSGCNIVLSQIRKYNNLLVEWYINDDKELYHQLYSKKEEIENETGISFDWCELPDKKASRIIAYKENVNFNDESEWESHFGWMAEVAIKMKKAFKKHL